MTLAEAAASADSTDSIRAALREATSKNADFAWLLDRFEQFWKESEEIIPRASDALVRNDLECFGQLVNESQVAAESLLRNQVPETTWLAKEASSLGAYAASAFGAGFGGSVWALVSTAEAAQFARRWHRAYERSSFDAAAQSEFFVTDAGPALIRW
jgi:galactokinase